MASQQQSDSAFADIFWGAAAAPSAGRSPEEVVRHALLCVRAFEAGQVVNDDTGGPVSLMELLATLGIEEDLVYASPELARGETIDERSLVFSVGVLIFERLTDHHPFGTTKDGRVARIKRGEMGSGIHYIPAVPKRLRAILLRAMGPFPEERYRGLRPLRAELAQFIGDPALGEPPPALQPPATQPMFSGAMAQATRGVEQTDTTIDAVPAPQRHRFEDADTAPFAQKNRSEDADTAQIRPPQGLQEARTEVDAPPAFDEVDTAEMQPPPADAPPPAEARPPAAAQPPASMQAPADPAASQTPADSRPPAASQPPAEARTPARQVASVSVDQAAGSITLPDTPSDWRPPVEPAVEAEGAIEMAAPMPRPAEVDTGDARQSVPVPRPVTTRSRDRYARSTVRVGAVNRRFDKALPVLYVLGGAVMASLFFLYFRESPTEPAAGKTSTASAAKTSAAKTTAAKATAAKAAAAKAAAAKAAAAKAAAAKTVAVSRPKRAAKSASAPAPPKHKSAAPATASAARITKRPTARRRADPLRPDAGARAAPARRSGAAGTAASAVRPSASQPAADGSPAGRRDAPARAPGDRVVRAIVSCALPQNGRTFRLAVHLGSSGRVRRGFVTHQPWITPAMSACLRKALAGLHLEVTPDAAGYVEWSAQMGPAGPALRQVRPKPPQK